MNSDMQKIQAAAAALDYVKDGMILGLGTGSTAAHFVRLLGQSVKKGLNVKGVPTSIATATLAKEVGVPLIDVEKVERIDLTIDGADEIDPNLNLIKGGGAALLREKIIAHASDQMIVIADESKLVENLGAFALPVEIVSFGVAITAKKVFDCLRSANCKGTQIEIRNNKDGSALITDNGNYILDCYCELIPNPAELMSMLNLVPGVVENGIFPVFANTRRTAILGTGTGPRIIEL